MSGLFGLIGAAFGAAGSKPVVPNLTPIDVQGEQNKAISGNVSALPSAERLASGVNLFNQQELMNMLTRSIPGYKDIQDAESKTILSLIRGQIPDANITATRSAEKAAGLGGVNVADLTARDLGIASLQATEAGLSAADRWFKTTDAMTNPGLFNVTSMFVSPAQQLASDTSERNAQFNVQWLKNQIAAQPSPVEKQEMAIADYFDSLGKSVLSSYVGGMTGSMGTAGKTFENQDSGASADYGGELMSFG